MYDRNSKRDDRGLFAWLGRAVVRHPWRVIALWVVAAVAVIATSPGLPSTTNESSFLPKNYESIRAMDLQDRAFPQSGHVTSAAAIIVFSRADGGKLTGADSAKVTAIAKDLDARGIHNIVSVTSGPASPNRLVQTAAVAMPKDVLNGSGAAAGDAVKALRADIKPLVAGTGLTEGVTGQAAQNLDSQQSFNRADQIVLLATLALILILLLIIFRSPIIAVLPLIVIGVVSQVATGLISDVNKAFNLNTDNSISTILIVVLFGIGTDYILFLMFRYRERLRSGEDRKQAMVSAVARVGEVISSAASVVICAFLALLLSTVSVLRSMGPTLAIAVGVTLVAGLTRLGVSVWGSRVLEVPGRKSGEPRRTPVNLLDHDGRRYLVAPRGQTQWVRNLRVSGWAELTVGRRTEHITAREITDPAEIVPVLRAYLRQWAWEVGAFFQGVGADASDEELAAIAPHHPVFAITG